MSKRSGRRTPRQDVIVAEKRAKSTMTKETREDLIRPDRVTIDAANFAGRALAPIW